MSTGVPGLYRVTKAQPYAGSHPLAGQWPWCSTNIMHAFKHVGLYHVETPGSSRNYCFAHMVPRHLREAVRGHNIREAKEDWSIEVEVSA